MILYTDEPLQFDFLDETTKGFISSEYSGAVLFKIHQTSLFSTKSLDCIERNSNYCTIIRETELGDFHPPCLFFFLQE